MPPDPRFETCFSYQQGTSGLVELYVELYGIVCGIVESRSRGAYEWSWRQSQGESTPCTVPHRAPRDNPPLLVPATSNYT